MNENNIIDFNLAAQQIREERAKARQELENLKTMAERVRIQIEETNMKFATTGMPEELNKLQKLMGQSLEIRNRIYDLEEMFDIEHKKVDGDGSKPFRP